MGKQTFGLLYETDLDNKGFVSVNWVCHRAIGFKAFKKLNNPEESDQCVKKIIHFAFEQDKSQLGN